MRLEDIPHEYFRRQDESSDFGFYQSPRLVAHIDDAAIAALGAFIRPRVHNDADVLDLMSAYLTHLPPDVRARCRRVAGLGMNDAEMAANAQLTDHVVHSLNDDPALPYADEPFDVALCTVSVQYLLHPIAVFAEVRRILRPGGQFLVSFSNRCFPTKATQLWLGTDDAQHVALVRLYFEQSEGWEPIETFDISPHPGRSDPLYLVTGRRSK
jgi:SAM-dependent methyltransferase